MTTTALLPVTARDLLARVGLFGPAVTNEELAFSGDLPAELVVALSVLHTGVRAALTGRKWYGCEGSTGRVIELNTAAPIPAGVALLTVAGDHQWDRISIAARL